MIMKLLHASAFLLLILQIGSAKQIGQKNLVTRKLRTINQIEDGNGAHGRILGGSEADLGEIPFQALIVMDNYFLSGGTLISENVVLTAGHCVYGLETFTITLGTRYSRGGDEGSQTQESRDAVLYETYDPVTANNDIALVRFSEKFNLTANIQIIKLPPLSDINQIYDNATVFSSGWGKTSDTSSVSFRLKYAYLDILPQSDCITYYGDFIDDAKICTVATIEGSPCNGDSGGPLVLEAEDGSRTQIGIVSTGGPSCAADPSVYVKVASFLEWISTRGNIVIEP